MAHSRLFCGSHGLPWWTKKAQPQVPVGTMRVDLWRPCGDQLAAGARPIWIEFWAFRDQAEGFQKHEKKRFPTRSLTNIKARSAYGMASKSMKKHWVFLTFAPKPSILLRKIDVFGFFGQPGGPDDDMNFGRPNKSLKNLAFLIYFFAAQVRDRKSRVQK